MSYRLLQGDALDVLETLEPQSVHCVVTSPPYWGLRDYGVDGQLGLEPTPEEYVAKMVDVFREVKRVLREDGVLWLNLGDSYASGGQRQTGRNDADNEFRPGRAESGEKTRFVADSGLKPKDLVGIPWRVAFALQADGWYLRSDIIWHKKSCMPESVTDRPTKSHEYIFLLTKKPRYYYDAEAVKEQIVSPPKQRTKHNGESAVDTKVRGYDTSCGSNSSGRNKRDVWTLGPEPFPGSHFAVFPQALVKPCILAGTSERGVCPACGKPWERVTETKHPPLREVRTAGPVGGHGLLGTKRFDDPIAVTTTGWRAGCGCDAGEPVPATVLDPFCGSGTTGLVALTYGRNFVGIDLSPEYLAMAERRIAPAAAQEVLAL